MPDNAKSSAKQPVPVKVKKNSEILRVLKQMSYNRLALAGFIIFVTIVILLILAPIIAPHPYTQLDLTRMHQPPSRSHWFGTDEFGRCILSRILQGGRFSVTMGVLSVSISMSIGVVIGAIAGYSGGWKDNIIMRILDVIQALPGMLLIIVISAVVGAGYFNTIIALAVNSIPHHARLLRGQILRVRTSEFVEAAQSINCSRFQIIFKHVVPNSISPLIVQSTLAVANMIVMAAALSFIGLGVQPPTPEWGAMLSGARQYIRDFPHMVIFPGLAIAITVLSLNLMGDGLRDALDPKLKR